MVLYSPKGGKHIKQMSIPPFWERCWREKVVSVFAHFPVPKNGPISKNRDHFFHANIPLKWINGHWFYAFATFGRVMSQFGKIAFFGPC